MKKIIILTLGLIAVSCDKENKQPTTQQTCNCYRQYQHLGAGGSWFNTTQTTPEPELCSKDGVIVIESSTSRYIWNCQ